MLAQQRPSTDGKSWKSARGELTIEHPTPLVVLFLEKGFLDADFANHIVAAMEASLRAPSRPTFFVDCESMDGYDPVVRSKATQWISRNRERIVAQHMLVKSRFAKMGLSVASLMLGGVIVGHYERDTFERALRAAIRETSSPRS